MRKMREYGHPAVRKYTDQNAKIWRPLHYAHSGRVPSGCAVRIRSVMRNFVEIGSMAAPASLSALVWTNVSVSARTDAMPSSLPLARRSHELA
jgi:hypothetical protein